MKKNLFVLLLGLLFSGVLQAKTIVISDIDDTLKRVHVRSTSRKLASFFDTKSKFLGMSDLYQHLNQAGKPPAFFYVSGAVEFTMKKQHKAFLKKSGFPAGEIYLRESLSEKTPVFKVRKITEIINSTRPQTLVFFGDNGEKDEEVLNTLMTQNPQIEIIGFIHQTYAAQNSANDPAIHFASVLDIIPALFAKGQIESAQAEKLAEDIGQKVAKELKSNLTYEASEEEENSSDMDSEDLLSNPEQDPPVDAKFLFGSKKEKAFPRWKNCNGYQQQFTDFLSQKSFAEAQKAVLARCSTGH